MIAAPGATADRGRRPADAGSSRRVPVVQRAVDAGAPAVFTLSTLLEDDRIAGTAVTLAALQLPVAGTTVSQATEVTIANDLAASALEIVENDQRKTVRLAPQVDQVVITGRAWCWISRRPP